MDLKDFTENEQEEIEKGLSKFISKQSVAIWYALTALLATFLVGQVILFFFPDISALPMPPRSLPRLAPGTDSHRSPILSRRKIGRASCRERV